MKSPPELDGRVPPRLGLLLCLLLSVGCSGGSSESGPIIDRWVSIGGVVRDSITLHPLEGATAYYQEGGSPWSVVAVSDSVGHYEFLLLGTMLRGTARFLLESYAPREYLLAESADSVGHLSYQLDVYLHQAPPLQETGPSIEGVR